MSGVPVHEDRDVAVDGVALLVGGVAICLAADRLALMTVLVPLLFVARLAGWVLVRRRESGALRVELAFLALCTALGGFNDFNTVVRHEVYVYTVPHYFPQLSSIPLWMLMFWGLILRFVASLASWRRLGATPALPNRVDLRIRIFFDTRVKVALLLAIVLITRQSVYRLWDHPIASWLPFAVGLVVYGAVFGTDTVDRRLGVLALVFGPIVEIAFIRIGGLHQYHLGWFGGVPLWIVLWWVLAVWIWRDLGGRLHGALAATLPGLGDPLWGRGAH